MNMTMRTRVAIESARRLVADRASTSEQNFPIPAVDVAGALIELHDILHDVAGERAGYRVKAERYEAAFTALQKEILDGVVSLVGGMETALSTYEDAFVALQKVQKEILDGVGSLASGIDTAFSAAERTALGVENPHPRVQEAKA